MDGYVLAWRWLAQAAVGGMIVLAVGSLAARLCRQPVRRARVVIFTLLGGLAVPWLGFLPIAPRWSAGIVLATPRLAAHSSVDNGAIPSLQSLPASNDLPPGLVALE